MLLFEAISKEPTVLLPIVIFILAIIFRVKLKNAVIGALTVGVGYAGLKIIVKFLVTSLGPASEAMVSRFHMKMDVLDIGFGAMGATGWAGGGSTYIVGILVLCILLTNIVLFFFLKRTNTLSIDLWNYHHMLLVCALVFFATHNIYLTASTAIVGAIIGFKLSDWASPLISGYFKIEGVTTPAFSALTGMLFVPINWVFDRIPGFNKINLNMGSLEKRFGLFADTTVLGFILGAIVGALAGYGFLKIFSMGISMATIMVLLPKMTHLFVDGIRPISNRVKEICDKRLKGRKILIGLDPSILVGDSAVITVSLLMIPTTIILAIILPGNTLMPFADLGAIVFKMALIVAFCKGNMFRAYIIGILFTIVSLYCATDTASLVSSTVHAANLAEGREGLVASLTGPAMPLSWVILKSFLPSHMNLYFTIPALLIGFAIVWFIVEKYFVNSKSEFIKKSQVK
jgi:PTS system galactitol-specific IIC component